eukprot:365498-Chlamydomonas_euryale.AAC.3
MRAHLHVVDQAGLVLVPQLAGLSDLRLALADHLVGQLGQEAGHVLRGVVIPRNCVHHLQRGAGTASDVSAGVPLATMSSSKCGMHLPSPACLHACNKS